MQWSVWSVIARSINGNLKEELIEGVIIKVEPTSPSEEDVAKVAADALDTLLSLMGITGKVQASSYEIPVALDIEGDDLGILIGRRGQTLASLEYIVKLIVAGQLKAWLPLSVDVAGYKKRRYDSLQKLALRLAEQVKLRHRAMTLEPMPSDERRIIHLALADDSDVVTRCVGEGEDRKVIISLK